MRFLAVTCLIAVVSAQVGPFLSNSTFTVPNANGGLDQTTVLLTRVSGDGFVINAKLNTTDGSGEYRDMTITGEASGDQVPADL